MAASQTLSPALLADLERIVGKSAVIADPERLLVYESDGLTAYRFPPSAVILPEDTAQTAEVVRRLARENLPVVPRGAGTGLSGGALALNGAVLVGTARMNRILSMNVEDRLARVQPGVINTALSAAARPHRLYYAPDPSSQTACTLGGNVAENSGGPHCLKYGVTSRYVTGLTVVRQDGEVLELGGVGRDQPGYDLVGLMVGSEGCLAIATEIEVRLLPLPEGVETLLAIFDEIEAAGRAVTQIIASGLLPAALEIVDQETIRAVEASVFAAGYPVDAAAALVVEFDGTVAGLEAEAEAAAEACRQNGAREVRRARDDVERAALWKGRKKAFGAMGRIAPDLLVQDATVPRTQLPAVLGRIGEIAKRHRLTVANVFHAGDGNLHPNILFDRRDTDELHRVEAASKEIMQACVDAGGTITGEHGVGLDKRAYMPLVHGPHELSVMAGVKAAFDPSGLLNPGKVIPDGVLPPPTANGNGKSSGGARESFSALLGADAVMMTGRLGNWGGGGEKPPVLLPKSEEQVAACLRLATERGWQIMPAGAGTWLSAGSPGPRPDALLSVSRLDRIVQYEPADLTLVAGAGISLAEVGRQVAGEGQWLPMDPPGSDEGTLGGTLATGSSGGLALGYGAPRDLVLGLRLVTGDGRVLRFGGGVVKNVAGFDLVKLAVGSWGTLGVITEASFRLFPRPQRELFLIARGGGLEELVSAAHRVACAAFMPAGVALLEGPVSDEPGGHRSATLLVRLVGAAQRVEREAQLIEQLLAPLAVEKSEGEGSEGASLSREVRLLEDGTELSVRMSLAASELPALVAIARSAGRLTAGRDELSTSPYRVAVDVLAGSLRLALPHARQDPPWEDAWAERLRDLRDTLRNAGGNLTILHGPAGLVRRVGAWSDVGGASLIMERLKAQFDPAGILPSGSWGMQPLTPAG